MLPSLKELTWRLEKLVINTEGKERRDFIMMVKAIKGTGTSGLRGPYVSVKG